MFIVTTSVLERLRWIEPAYTKWCDATDFTGTKFIVDNSVDLWRFATDEEKARNTERDSSGVIPGYYPGRPVFNET